MQDILHLLDQLEENPKDEDRRERYMRLLGGLDEAAPSLGQCRGLELHMKQGQILLETLDLGRS